MDFATKVKILAAGAAAVFVLILIKKKGAAAGVGEDLGHAAVDLAGGVATGVIDGVSTAIGIPTIGETLTDNDECRQFMNAYGVWESIGKCAAPAFTATASQSVWEWLTTPSASDYTLKPTTGAFDRQL